MTQHLRNLMVEANDPKKHDVCFSRMGGAWMLENEQVGLIGMYNTFDAAISKMAELTGLNGSGYEWTVRSNPYGGD